MDSSKSGFFKVPTIHSGQQSEEMQDAWTEIFMLAANTNPNFITREEFLINVPGLASKHALLESRDKILTEEEDDLMGKTMSPAEIASKYSNLMKERVIDKEFKWLN